MQTRHPATVLAGRYALDEELGRSATGMVWRAEDRLLGRTVTVKIVHPSLGDDPAFCDRLAGETRRVASLAAPGVARLLDSGEEEGVPFLVREHVDGESVRSLLDRSGPRPPAEAVRIAVGTLEALAPAHDAGVLHLHLEPDDVLVAPDGSIRVTDLGIGPAVMSTRPPAEAARLLGGAGLAPEQTGEGTHREVDGRADVFATGALLFELLTGKPPNARRSVREARANVPRPLDRAVAKALDPDPDRRFEDLRVFAAALRATEVADEAPSARRGWMRTWLGVPVVVGVLAVAAIAAGLWLGGLEVGGPLGIRPAQDPAVTRTPVRPARELSPVGVDVTDPFGDRSENGSGAPLAIDGDPDTAWRSEGYRYPEGSLNKPGVGLIFDLGQTHRLAGFRLLTSLPGFTFHLAAGDDPDELIPEIGEQRIAAEITEGSLTGTGRYVLVWITSVVPSDDGNRAEVAEFVVDVADGD